ncbi:hypothetical protein Ae505Ps2_4095c [Pseudonocardia sp. Ae505_Ps2]|nr:hypothetical protein Ae505Ps2_4095c [Pseudonocardia sp. Ae505_Ps2]
MAVPHQGHHQLTAVPGRPAWPGTRVRVGDVGRVGHGGPARRPDLLGDGGGAVGVPVVDGDGVPVA